MVTTRSKSKQFSRKPLHPIIGGMIPLQQQSCSGKGMIHGAPDTIGIQHIFLEFLLIFAGVVNQSQQCSRLF